MNRIALKLVLAIMVSLMMTTLSAWANVELEKATGEELAQIVFGGVLYDKWSGALGVDAPKQTHPAYAASKGKRKGSGTWRCKECHGWDYMGKDGAYKSGSHFSGIPGIRSADGASESKLVAVLKNKDHQLGEHIPTAGMKALAAFMAKGQLDMDQYIDRGSKKAKGNLGNGERVYMTVCTKCHGDDGKKINFKDEKKPEYLGTVAAGNPWETLHKIRMGQPGKEMPAMLAFPVQLQVDVLAYSQTLPTK